MVYGTGLSDFKAKFETNNLKIEKIYQIENNSYSFIDILIPADIKPGTYKLKIYNNELCVIVTGQMTFLAGMVGISRESLINWIILVNWG
jgi:hypothetical protein